MNFNQFVHQEGLTAEREAFWQFVRDVACVGLDTKRDKWWQLLAQFEEWKSAEVQ